MTDDSRRRDPALRWTAAGTIAAVIGVVVAVVALGRDAADYEPFAKPDPTVTTARTTATPGTKQVNNGLSARQTYVRDADAVCRPWLARTGQVTQSQADDLTKMRQTVTIYYSMLADWRSVPPPQADRGKVDAIIDGYTDVAEKLDDMRRYAEGGEIARAQAASEEADDLAEVPRKNGRAFGFRVCVD